MREILFIMYSKILAYLSKAVTDFDRLFGDRGAVAELT